MLPFLESPRFNVCIRYGTTGGPSFHTDVTTTKAGSEFRNSNWLDSKGRWELGPDVYDKLEVEALASFFRERKGRLGAFRFKDWTDFRVRSTEGKVVIVVTESEEEGAEPTIAYQMVKVYSWGGQTFERIITKPVPGTVKFYNIEGVELTDIAVDFKTGRAVVADETVTWEGEFDVPVRFDADTFEVVFNGYRKRDGETLYTVSGLTIREVSA